MEENNRIKIKGKSGEAKTQKRKSGFRTFFKVLFIILFILILLVASVIGGSYLYMSHKLDTVDYVDIPKNEIEVNTGVEENLSNYRNIALFGLDSRMDNFDDSRSDCIMIISINNKTNDVRIGSVYRDTYVDIQGHGLDKITHAYAYGGAKLSMNTLNKNLDLDIKEFVTVNFETVKTVIDTIGGVEITVTDAESQSIPNISGAGTYNLNGTQALAYSRIRKIDTDYKRTERMRTVLNAVFEKLKKQSPAEILSFVDVILPHISTNIPKNEIIAMAPSILSYKITNDFGWPYEVKGITLDRWYGVPVTLETNVVKLHQDLFGEQNYTASDTVKSISNRIISKTNYSK